MYHILSNTETRSWLIIPCISTATLILSINKLLELSIYGEKYFALWLVLKPEGRNLFVKIFFTDVSELDSI